MKMENKNMPAMPITAVNKAGDMQQTEVVSNGLTKREHFAAMAMQGLLAADTNDEWPADRTAIYAVKCADALLEALSKEL